MKGGNGVRVANGITQFAEGEPKRLKGDILYCVSRKRPLDGACLGRQLDGGAVKLFFLLRTDVRDPEWFPAASFWYARIEQSVIPLPLVASLPPSIFLTASSQGKSDGKPLHST